MWRSLHCEICFEDIDVSAELGRETATGNFCWEIFSIIICFVFNYLRMDSWQGHCLCTSNFCFSFFHKFEMFTLTFLSFNLRIKHNMLVFMLVMMNLTLLSRLYLMKSFNVIMVSTWTKIKLFQKIMRQDLLHNCHLQEDGRLNLLESELHET